MGTEQQNTTQQPGLASREEEKEGGKERGRENVENCRIVVSKDTMFAASVAASHIKKSIKIV